MTKITDYTTLVKAVKDAAEDDGTEFSAFIPTAVGLAEERLIKEIDLNFSFTETISNIANNNIISKPNNYRFGLEMLLIEPSGNRIQMIKTNINFLRDYWPNEANTGVPKYYADENENSFRIAPTPDIDYQFHLMYSKSPDALSETNFTNFFTEKMPDSIFYATMSEMMLFNRSFNMKNEYDQKYLNSISAINNQGRRERRDEGKEPMNPESGLNTLTNGV